MIIYSKNKGRRFMKEKLQKFFEKFTIKKKIVIACIPFFNK